MNPVPANFDLSDLQPLLPFTRVGDCAPLLWQSSTSDSQVVYLADDNGLWMRVPSENHEEFDFEAVTGFRLDALKLKMVDGVGVYALKDGAPLLPFPFTAAQFLALDERTGRVFSERITCGNETVELLAEIAQRNPKSAHLARALLYGEVPPDQISSPALAVTESSSGETARPLPLTTGDIAFCFAGLRWKTEGEWKAALGKQRDWIEACVAVPAGGRGRGAAPKLWNPVLLAAALFKNEDIKLNSARAIFQNKQNRHLLGPWLDTWKTYEADNFDTY